MNSKLKQIIQTVKSELGKDPSSIIIGKICDGNKNETLNCDPKVQLYYDFLKECDGASCGSIDFWNSEMVLNEQYKVTDMPGGRENWFCIGQILYEPIVLNKTDTKVYRFYQGFEDGIELDCFGDFDDFLLEYVFGDKYAKIIPEAYEDEWYRLLKKLNLF